jgi:hypothetical protein
MDATPVCAGRLVLPPNRLPTEVVCGIRVEPAGRVVDAGRLVVLDDRGGPRHAVFAALLAALFLQARARGYRVGCGMMAANARALARMMGLQLEILGAERDHQHERRAPVRFEMDTSRASLLERWGAVPASTTAPGPGQR